MTTWRRMVEDEQESGGPANKDVEDEGDAAGVDPLEGDEAREGSGIDGDLLDCIITLANTQLEEVCNDWVHQNDGVHLDGGIKNTVNWQARWPYLIILPTHWYDAPGGLSGVASCKCLPMSSRASWSRSGMLSR